MQDSPAAPKTPVSLWSKIGAAVRVVLTNGSIREGFVYAVDPEKQTVLILTKQPSDAHFTWCPSLIFSASIESFSDIDLGGTDAFLAAVSAHPDLMHTKSVELPLSSDSALAERRQKALDLIRKHRLEVVVDAGGQSLSVLGGLVHIRPPYTPESCSSTNELVLKQVAALLSSL